MNAFEKLEAATEKLTALRCEATSAPWALGVFGSVQSKTRDGFNFVTLDTAEADAALIVTLHHTIDAQLAFLGDHLADLRHTTETPNFYALNLADAILAAS